MKTLAIRLEDDQHARLTILAKLSGISMTDAIRAAIEGHIDKLAADTDISAKAETVLADIEREASEQRAAIASLFGEGAKAATSKPARGSTGTAKG
jgi:predicted DNA-binding protein